MKNFKDLLHNTNDIIIAVIIVVMAAGLIVWRFNVIMKYPQVLASQSSRKQSEEAHLKTAFSRKTSASRSAVAVKAISLS